MTASNTTARETILARIREALLPDSEFPGWRLGPWLADNQALAGVLLDRLCGDRQGLVLVDAPEANPRAHRLLEEENVAVMPGESFGPALNGWLRLSLTRSDDELTEACRRIAAFAARQLTGAK